MDASTVTQVTQTITGYLASASGIVVTAGLALVGIAFVSFVLRKAKGAASGRV